MTTTTKTDDKAEETVAAELPPRERAVEGEPHAADSDGNWRPR